MQRILDLDLDVFVRPLKSYCKETNERASSKHYRAMPAEEIVSSLDTRLRLSASNRIPGVITDLHKDVYFYWRDLIRLGHLKPPFEVVHVDGHADLGMGDASYTFIQEEWIHATDKLVEPPTGGLTGLGSGNYLAFALANGWISSLIYVCHEDEPEDLPDPVFKNWDAATEQIELRYLTKGCFSGIYDPNGWSRIPYDRSIVVPFSRTPLPNYVASSPFDFVFVARSPAYTPIELDFVEQLVEQRLIALPQ